MENKDLSWSEFLRVEMRIGTIVEAKVFEKAKKPAYQILIDFGEFGVKKTSAQITKLYNPEEILGRQVIAVVNFPPKQIANMQSECLLLGGVGEDHEVVLIQPERMIQNGTKVG